jgi:hypothetical protein
MRLYGLTANQVDALNASGSRCAICGIHVDNPKALHVDHDHKSGNVRGLLCANCNAVVGMIESGYAFDLAAILRYLDGGHLNLVPGSTRQPEREKEGPQDWLF